MPSPPCGPKSGLKRGLNRCGAHENHLEYVRTCLRSYSNSIEGLERHGVPPSRPKWVRPNISPPQSSSYLSIGHIGFQFALKRNSEMNSSIFIRGLSFRTKNQFGNSYLNTYHIGFHFALKINLEFHISICIT